MFWKPSLLVQNETPKAQQDRSQEKGSRGVRACLPCTPFPDWEGWLLTFQKPPGLSAWMLTPWY